jgi:hypothetical protein
VLQQRWLLVQLHQLLDGGLWDWRARPAATGVHTLVSIVLLLLIDSRHFWMSGLDVGVIGTEQGKMVPAASAGDTKLHTTGLQAGNSEWLHMAHRYNVVESLSALPQA